MWVLFLFLGLLITSNEVSCKKYHIIPEEGISENGEKEKYVLPVLHSPSKNL